MTIATKITLGDVWMNRFRELRIAHGYKTQKELADALFVNQTAVSQWERGATRPTSEMQIKLSKLYNVSIDYLLGNDSEEKKSPAENLSEAKREMIELVDQLSDEQVSKLLQIAKAALAL